MSYKSLAVSVAVAAAAALALMASPASSAPQQSPATALAYTFAADAETLLKSPLQNSFSCEGKAYGYYADVANGCQVFHICLPLENDAGEVTETAHWSFICGNGTIFDQATLTCNHEADAFPCEDAASLYGAVEFGKVDSAQTVKCNKNNIYEKTSVLLLPPSKTMACDAINNICEVQV